MTGGHSLFSAVCAALAPLARGYPVHSRNVAVLHSPSQFRDVLHNCLAAARRRVTLASLYLGAEGPHERQLLSSLAAAAAQSADMRVSLVLDAHRASRPTGVDAVTGQPASCASACAQVLLPAGAAVYLHKRHPLAEVLPHRTREVLGVCHVKAAVFDDNVLWTGANLSEQYLTHRQDRYILIRDSPELADATAALLQRMQAHSGRLRSDGAVTWPPGSGSSAALAAELRDLLQPADGADTRGVDTQNVASASSAPDTVAYLTMQAGYAGLTHDTQCLVAALGAVAQSAAVGVSTPYCNLASAPSTSALLRVLGQQARLHMLTASPGSHAWAGEGSTLKGGISSKVAPAYAVLTHKTADALHRQAAVAGRSITWREYTSAGRQFHAKGIWVMGNADADAPRTCAATVVGSSNFGSRSSVRDLEMNCVLATRGEALQQALGAEWASLADQSRPVTLEQLAARRRGGGLGGALVARAAARWM